MRAINTLFGTHIRNRPKASDPAVLRATAEALYANMTKFDIEQPDVEDEKEQVLQDIESVLSEWDSYRRARRLESRGWEVDASVVEWLESVHIHDAKEAAVKAWVITEGIAPALAVGALVTVPRPFDAPQGEPTINGEIVRIDEASAEYTVFLDACGHVRQGLGTHGIILPFEQVEGRDVA